MSFGAVRMVSHLTVKVDRHRLVINLAVAIEVDELPGGALPYKVQAVGIATKAGLLQLVLVQVLVDAGSSSRSTSAVRSMPP